MPEEQDYLDLIAQAKRGLTPEATRKERAATNQVVKDHLWLVRRNVRKYDFGAHKDDLYQVGSVALLTALRKFNPEVGVKFSTYANWWVRRDIQRLAWGDKRKQARSLDAPVGDDSDTLAVDQLADPAGVRPDDALETHVSRETARSYAGVVALLAPKEARVVEMRYGLPPSTTTSKEGTVAFDMAVLEAVCRRAQRSI